MIVEIDEKALKELYKIHKGEVKKIFKKIESLEDYPNISNIKKLTNHEPPYRLRVGDYRVLFDVEDEVLTVYRVRHRSKSYD